MIFRTLSALAIASVALVAPAGAATVSEATVTDAGGFDVTAGPGSSFPADHTPFVGTIFGGEGIAISGVENFTGVLAGGGLMSVLSFQLYQPSTTQTLEGCNTTCVDSTFDLSFFLSGVLVSTVTLIPPKDVVVTYTVTPSGVFDMFEFAEVVGSNDNEFFANFTATLAPIPLPAGGVLLLSGLALLGLRRRKR